MPTDVISNSTKWGLFFKMPEGRGHHFVRPSRRWGRDALILFLLDLSRAWAIRHPSRPMALGDLAEEDGHDMPDHKSHFTGLVGVKK